MPHSLHLQPTLPQTHSSFMTDSNVQALASLDNLVMSSASQKQYSGGGGHGGEEEKKTPKHNTNYTAHPAVHRGPNSQLCDSTYPRMSTSSEACFHPEETFRCSELCSLSAHWNGVLRPIQSERLAAVA